MYPIVELVFAALVNGKLAKLKCHTDNYSVMNSGISIRNIYNADICAINPLQIDESDSFAYNIELKPQFLIENKFSSSGRIVFYKLEKPEITYAIINSDNVIKYSIVDDPSKENRFLSDKLIERFVSKDIFLNFLNPDNLNFAEISLVMLNNTKNRTYIYETWENNYEETQRTFAESIGFVIKQHEQNSVGNFSSIILVEKLDPAQAGHVALLIVDHKNHINNSPLLYLMDSAFGIFQIENQENDGITKFIANSNIFGNFTNNITCLNIYDCFQSNWSCTYCATEFLRVINRVDNIEEIIGFHERKKHPRLGINYPLLRPIVFKEFYESMGIIQMKLVDIARKKFEINYFPITEQYEENEVEEVFNEFIINDDRYLVNPTICKNFENHLCNLFQSEEE